MFSLALIWSAIIVLALALLRAGGRGSDLQSRLLGQSASDSISGGRTLTPLGATRTRANAPTRRAA